MFPLFIYCTSGHCLSKSSLQLMLVSAFTSWNSRNKRTYFAQVRLYCVLLKKKTTSVWWVKSNWFDFIHYTEIIFLSKNVIFLYILKIFFTMLHLKIFLEYWIILYIFRISLCVTSPLKMLTNINPGNMRKSLVKWVYVNRHLYWGEVPV